MTDDTTIERAEVKAMTVRHWAQANGIPVGSRGHIAQDVIDSFNRRHRKVQFTNTNPMVNR